MNRRRAWLERDARIQREIVEFERQGRDHKTELAHRLGILASSRRCHENVTSWLATESRPGRRKAVVISKYAHAVASHHRAIALKNLEYLQDGALLSLSVLVEKTSRLVSYNVSLQGRGRTTGAPWYARIDLTEEPEGEGPCGHPLLHCHVGTDPAFKGEPETRVPLPFLTPAGALDWLLATVDHSLEPSDSEEG